MLIYILYQHYIYILCLHYRSQLKRTYSAWDVERSETHLTFCGQLTKEIETSFTAIYLTSEINLSLTSTDFFISQKLKNSQIIKYH